MDMVGWAVHGCTDQKLPLSDIDILVAPLDRLGSGCSLLSAYLLAELVLPISAGDFGFGK